MVYFLLFVIGTLFRNAYYNKYSIRHLQTKKTKTRNNVSFNSGHQCVYAEETVEAKNKKGIATLIST